MNQNILVTGGAGYIGAHTCQELLKAGHRVVVLDNLSTGKQANIPEGAEFVEGDFADEKLVREILKSHEINAVMHFAASIEVGESVEKPVEYLDNNTIKTTKLLESLKQEGVTKFIFSSTAAVYGLQENKPLPETASLNPIDPYGHSKLLSEKIIEYFTKHAGLNAIIFRYFNACGTNLENPVYSSHQSHLIPRVVDVAMGRKDCVQVYGSDYDTIDGSGVRDYVHVVDIARAHIKALEKLGSQKGLEIYNIGTSSGLSVMQIIDEVQKLTGKNIKVEKIERRAGDSPVLVADNSKIKAELDFNLKNSSLENIVKSSLR